MNYLSYQYLVFIFILFLIYYSVPSTHRWKVLLSGNVIFLACVSSLSQVFALIVIYTICFLSGKALSVLPRDSHRKNVFIIAVSLILCPFTMSRVSNFMGGGKSWFMVGISFWTLQMISYLADIYTGKSLVCDSPAKLFLYFSFFPQIVQGPIPRYDDLYPQLISHKDYDSKNTDLGIMRILYGFFLKLMIADKAKIIVDNVFSGWKDCSGSICWIAAILYSIELYTDFRACVEISKGVGCIFGIRLPSNFHRPYLSTSIKEFWRRWHITLSLWLRDYIYFPLGGNKKGRVRKYSNILIVFVLSGFWHGGGVNFLLWGLMHGMYQIIEDILDIGRHKSKVYTSWRVIITFTLVTIAWVMFRADYAKQGIIMILHMLTFRRNADSALNFWNLGLSVKQWGVFALAILVLIGTENEKIKNQITSRVLNANIVLKGLIYVAVGIVLTIFGTYGYGYNAQDFIYGGF